MQRLLLGFKQTVGNTNVDEGRARPIRAEALFHGACRVLKRAGFVKSWPLKISGFFLCFSEEDDFFGRRPSANGTLIK
jgi:hypothetical protein